MATTFASIILSARQSLNEIYALVTPGSPLVSPQGTPGVTTYSYKVVARNANGTSEASQIGTTALGAAALTGVNFNRLTWTAVPYAVSYDIYRTVGGATTGKIVSATSAVTADDTGLAGDSATAPTVNTSGVTNANWTDAELLSIAVKGAADLWRSIVELDESHFIVIDETNVSLAASSDSLTGVPSDVAKVSLIEPRDLTDANTSRYVTFVPKKYNHPDFASARAVGSVEPSDDVTIYYELQGAGSPVAAPTIKVGPKLSSALTLKLVYVPTLGTGSLLTTSNNPIPGESDNAIVAWTIAYAYAKDEADHAPHSGWLAIYATEKQNILNGLTPRQTQEPEMVDAIFQNFW